MTQISQQSVQSFSMHVNSQGQTSVHGYQSQSIEVGKPREHRDDHRHRDNDQRYRDRGCPDLNHSRHNCSPLDLFPRQPHYPGLDTSHGRRSFFEDARKCGDAMRLLELARYEADQQMMPDIKAGDILREAYHTALGCRDAMPLVGIAELEIEKKLLPDIKAGDLLRESYHKAVGNKDAQALLEISKLENKHQLLPDIKAGDLLREAYHAALKCHDGTTMMEIAQFEKDNNLMSDIAAEAIMQEAYNMMQRPSFPFHR